MITDIRAVAGNDIRDAVQKVTLTAENNFEQEILTRFCRILDTPGGLRQIVIAVEERRQAHP